MKIKLDFCRYTFLFPPLHQPSQPTTTPATNSVCLLSWYLCLCHYLWLLLYSIIICHLGALDDYIIVVGGNKSFLLLTFTFTIYKCDTRQCRHTFVCQSPSLSLSPIHMCSHRPLLMISERPLILLFLRSKFQNIYLRDSSLRFGFAVCSSATMLIHYF